MSGVVHSLEKVLGDTGIRKTDISAVMIGTTHFTNAVVERRQLEVLHAESDRAFVRGTLRDGETVVAMGLHRLVPGLVVHVASVDVPGAPAASRVQ